MCRLTLSGGMREVKGTHSLVPNVRKRTLGRTATETKHRSRLSTSVIGPNDTRRCEMLTAYLYSGKSFRSGFFQKRTSPEQSTTILAQKVWVWFYSHHCSLRVHKMFLLSDQWEVAEHHRHQVAPSRDPSQDTCTPQTTLQLASLHPLE